MGIVAIPASNYMTLLLQYSFSKHNLNDAMEIQTALSRINFELQTASPDSIEGTYTPSTAIKRAVSFNNTLSDNREIRERETGIYLYDGTSEYPLFLGEDNNSATLTLNYLDTSNALSDTWALNPATPLKLIQITIQVERDDLDEPLTFTTSVFPRG